MAQPSQLHHALGHDPCCDTRRENGERWRMAIQSFRSDQARAIFEGRGPGKGFPSDLIRATKRKLEMLEATPKLDGLRLPPNNRLEALWGDLAGWFSIRVNDQFRLVFQWTSGGPAKVDFIDYH